MSILPPSATKHDLNGIGSASAAGVVAALATNPSTSFLTAGFIGKIVFYLLKTFFTSLASMGLVLLNVGAEKLLAAIDRSNFDGSLDTAEKLIQEIRNTGRELTPEETKQIDDKVIEQFRKFAKMTRKKQNAPS